MNDILKYKISGIKTNKFSIDPVHDIDNLQLKSYFKFKVNVEEHIVSCIGLYEYIKDGKDVMQLELECFFKVESGCFKSLIEKDTLTLSQDILQYLATIAVGTARGEIHARCAEVDSVLQDVVLPPINVTNIITSPAIFKLPQ